MTNSASHIRLHQSRLANSVKFSRPCFRRAEITREPTVFDKAASAVFDRCLTA